MKNFHHTPKYPPSTISIYQLVGNLVSLEHHSQWLLLEQNSNFPQIISFHLYVFQYVPLKMAVLGKKTWYFLLEGNLKGCKG